ncbi:MAG: fasciclin domain-containing protein, partial [Coleofasciculaceae cyanobacterium]
MKFSFLNRAFFKRSLLVSLSFLVLFSAIAINNLSKTQANQPALSAIAQQSTANLTIAEIVAQSGGEYDNNPQDFDILLNALKQNNLVDFLADKTTDVTVFAPDDAAFLKLSRFFGYSGNDEAAVIDVINQEFTKANQFDVANGGSDPNAFNLREVLRYHISPGAKTLDAIQKLPANKTIRTMFQFEVQPADGFIISYINGNLVDIAPNLISPRIQQNLKDIPAS